MLSLSLLGQAAPANLDFAKGSLAGWEGKGFAFTAAEATRPAGASSVDQGAVRTGMIRFAFQVPANARQLTFQAFADVKGDHEPDQKLSVVLAGANNVPVPMIVKLSNGAWSPTTRIQLPWLGKPRMYAWDVTAHQGKLMQVVLIDQDERPGHFLWAGNFQLVMEAQSSPPTPQTAEVADADFGPFMLKLQEKNKLSSMGRFDSKRFTAISNASDKFTTERLQNCEVFYDQFFKHFQVKGFAVHVPTQRMMIAIFDSHEGFDAYFGQRMPSGIAGVYHTGTNRLVLYDFADNRGLVAYKDAAIKKGDTLPSGLGKDRYYETVDRKMSDISKDANLSTTMHECAHQISFNCGLLNRKGDVPASIAEGLATYCEATDEGNWTMLGTVNPLRIDTLRRAQGHYIPLGDLLRNEKWLQSSNVLLGYSQSWALFHLMMHQHPAELQRYLKQIEGRRTPEYRLADFQEAFGSLPQFESRYRQYLNDLIQKTPPTKQR